MGWAAAMATKKIGSLPFCHPTIGDGAGAQCTGTLFLTADGAVAASMKALTRRKDEFYAAQG
jgi:hypothetical protein